MAVSSPRGIWVGAIWTKSIILPINDIANSPRVFVIIFESNHIHTGHELPQVAAMPVTCQM